MSEECTGWPKCFESSKTKDKSEKVIFPAVHKHLLHGFEVSCCHGNHETCECWCCSILLYVSKVYRLFVEDGASAHTVKATQDMCQALSQAICLWMKHEGWPKHEWWPNSPDPDGEPVGHAPAWQYAEAKPLDYGLPSNEEFSRLWKKFPCELLQNLVDSLFN